MPLLAQNLESDEIRMLSRYLDGRIKCRGFEIGRKRVPDGDARFRRIWMIMLLLMLMLINSKKIMPDDVEFLMR